MTGAAAHVSNERLDVIGGNALGRALYGEMLEGGFPANSARFAFLDPRAREFYADWPRIARDTIAVLRLATGRHPHDRELRALVDELAKGSEEFRFGWADHDVHAHLSGVKVFHHPTVGRLELNFERLDLGLDPGLTVFTYTADPGSRSAEALALLASWAATEELAG